MPAEGSGVRCLRSALPAVGEGYTTYWSVEVCDGARAVIDRGLLLPLLFGGPHLSMPALSRLKIDAGDVVYPVAVRGRRLHMLGRLQVSQVLPFGAKELDLDEDSYLRRFPEWAFPRP